MGIRISWQAAVGILCGIALWMAVGMRGNVAEPSRPAGAILPECEGALEEVVIQYVPGATFAEKVYLQLLPQLPADVTVDVVCTNATAFAELQRKLGTTSCRLRPVVTGHAMTTWSRDRWVALWDQRSGKTTLVAPAQEEGVATWPQREGDSRIAFTLAGSDPEHLRAWRSPLLFDGGDLLADRDGVFVTPAVLQRNLKHTVESRKELLDELEHATGRNVRLLEAVPEHHAGMFMMAAGSGVMVVGDPSVAKRVWEERGLWPEGAEDWRPGFSPEMQAKFDNAARQAAEAGYRVVRIPTVPGAASKAYITYVNVLIDARAGAKVVYMPAYRGLEKLNADAGAVWRGLGYEVREIDCTEVFPHFGTLHCLANVVRRSMR